MSSTSASRPDPPRPNPDARVPFKSVHSHSVHLEVYLPSHDEISCARSRDGAGIPCLVWVHGGGWFDGAASDYSLPNLVPTLARGWAFIAVEYRLVPQVTLKDCVDDVRDACEFVQSGELDRALGAARPDDRVKLDGQRLAVSGSSAGGALALFASYTLSPPPRAVFALYAGSDLSFPSCHAPVAFPSGTIAYSDVAAHLDPHGPVVSSSPAQVDFSTLVAHGRTRACFWAVQEGKAIELAVPGFDSSSSSPDRAVYDDDDPVLAPYIATNLVERLGNATPPTVLVHGTDDLMVPVEISRKLFAALQRHGVKSQLLEEPGANHGFDLIPGVVRDAAKMKVFYEALDFVEKYL
ncbi:hypothetical protein JCM11491_001077 [Sporobolomyces phaffii]